MNHRQSIALLTGWFASLGLSWAATPPEHLEFFESKIRPVLAENCYQCHNSIDKKKGDIALDYRAALLESDVIVPGDPEKSRLLRAIRHAPEVEPMPSKAPKLANVIIKNFADWIRLGAPDPRINRPTKEELSAEVDWESVRDRRKEWWSFQPISTRQPPIADSAEWNQSPIDQFVHDQIRRRGLTAQAEAAPESLVRRLHLILIGLPPEPSVVESFVADPSREAYEKMVEALLASPRFGERWARYWMDWYRYAESHGSEGDPRIPHAAQYRDYLIRALNADVPYDQLVREHVAGDLLPSPRINEDLELNESAIGLAHFRMSPQGFGVTDAYGEQITFTDNQIDVLTKATLGLTVSCARCHNHKFDPISQKDFYRFYGIMISSRPAIVNVDSPALQNRHRVSLQEMKSSIRKNLSDYWLERVDEAVERLTRFPFDNRPKKPAKGEPTAEYELNREVNRFGQAHPFGAWKLLSPEEPSGFASAVRGLQADHEEAISHNEALKKGATFYADLRDQSTYDRWVKGGNGLSPTISPAGSFAVAGEGDAVLTGIYPSGVYSHLISDKHSATLGSLFHQAKGARTEIRAIGSQATARFSVRSYPLTHGGLHPAPELPPVLSWLQIKKYFYWNDEKGFYQLETALDKTALRRGRGGERSWFGLVEVYAGDGAMRWIGAPWVSLVGDAQSVRNLEGLISSYRQILQGALEAWANESISDWQAEFLDAFVRHGFLTNDYPSLPDQLREQIKAYRSLENDIPIPRRAPGVIEGQPWAQPLLARGDYRKEEAAVPRGFLEVFSQQAYDAGESGRLVLADDLLSAENPLTARVIANRLWHHVFGRGIVSSVDNFGRLGSQPTHPELLDYLANDLRANGWSLKRLIRQMVMSRTFRAGSQAPAANQQDDPSNLSLAHFPPRRLDAEAILDSIHFVSTRLDPRRPELGGNGNSGQRAVYRPVRRNFLDPFLTAFNYPVPTTTTGARNLTNVPAQSLLLMNGQAAKEAAKVWSRELVARSELISNEDRIEWLFRRAYSRAPTSEENEAALTFLASSAGEDAPRAEDYFAIAHAILNSKELIYVH